MTYDSPLSAFGGEVIPEVASFIEEGLVIPEGWDWEKGKLKIWYVVHTGNWTPESCMKCKSADHYTIQGLLWIKVDYNKLTYEIKAPISPTLHKPRLTWSILGIKAYLLL